MKQASNNMRVETKRSFLSPLHGNRLVEEGQVFNAPRNKFWLRRLAQKDVAETTKAVTRAQPPKEDGKKSDSASKAQPAKGK